MEKNESQLRKESIETLISLGLFKYFKDVDLYHGRAGSGDDSFAVRELNNSGNNTGNLNVSEMSGLYVSSEEVARQFAEVRTKQKGGIPEVHKIVSVNDDELILDLGFEIAEMSKEDRKKASEAFARLANFSVSSALPINFNYKNIYFEVIFPVLKTLQTIPISDEEEKDVLKAIKNKYQQIIQECNKRGDISRLRDLSITDKQLEKLASDYINARNTRYLLILDPVTTIWDAIDGNMVSLNNKTYFINHDYLSAWLYNNHVAGFKFLAKSATLDKKIDVYQLVNIKQIMTQKEYGNYFQYMLLLEQVNDKLFKNIFNSELENFMETASGDELIKFVSRDSGCKDLFEKDAGIWEKWSVGQHSACVIDFFNKYYSTSLPKSMHSIMKLILLSHDIGKGEAVKRGINQIKANEIYMNTLFDYLKVPVKIRKLVKFVINDSQSYTSQILLKNSNPTKEASEQFIYEKQAIKRLNDKCYNILYEIYNGNPTTAEVDTLRNLCLILQFCDSGAYTFYAKIKEDNAYITGGNKNFTDSFEMTNKNTPILKKAQKLGLVLVSNEKTKAQNDVNNPLLVM